MKTICSLFFACTIMVLSSACSKNDKAKSLAEAPKVDAKLAYKLVDDITQIGPHGSGSPGAQKAVDLITAFCKKLNVTTTVDAWTDLTPKGKMTFKNVHVTIPGRSDSFIIVGSHYDSKLMESIPDFAGANDSGSSTGLLLAMIKAIKKSGKVPPHTLRFTFFDGEECMVKYTQNDGFYGSRHYADKLEKSGELKKCKAIVILDMIGDKDLKVTLSRDTNKELADLLFRIAKKNNTSNYFSWHAGNIMDDHTPFQEKGIPAIDLIDFEFGPNNLYWHTKADTMDKISEKSLKIIGDTALQLLWNIE